MVLFSQKTFYAACATIQQFTERFTALTDFICRSCINFFSLCITKTTLKSHKLQKIPAFS